MLRVNEQLTQEIPGGVGDSKFRVVIESDSRDELEGSEAKRMALDVASRYGWGNAGLNDTNPVIDAVDERTDQPVGTLEPGVPIKCYRVEFTIAKRL